MFVFIRCPYVWMSGGCCTVVESVSICMSVGICMQSPVGVYTTCRLVLSSCLVAHLSPHTAHKRLQYHKSQPLPTAKPTANPRKPRTTGTKIPAQLTEKHNYGASRVLTTQETTSTAIDGTITQSQVDKITETPRTNKHTD
jgi:hypothetical protein